MKHRLAAEILRSPLLKIVALAMLTTASCTRQSWRPWDVMTEVDRMSANSLWPGFEPQRYPVAIYDGEASYLFRHPSPPPEFTELPSQLGVWHFGGQHESIRANTSTELGGVATATYMVTPGQRVATEQVAAVIIHELFHVYQSSAYPQWQANEATLFSLPDDDLKIIGLRRLETYALRQALISEMDQAARCWAALALKWRGERFGLVSDDVALYERQIERKEGLADYLQRHAWPGGDPGLPEGGYAPEEGRLRGYGIGRTMAQLLDRFQPGWKNRLSANPDLILDQLLTRAARGATGACKLDVTVKQQIVAGAVADVAEMNRQRKEVLSDMAQREGWTISITAPLSNRLWSQGFDPVNIDRLPNGMLLHNRWLKLANEGAFMEVSGRDCLTLPAGEHPMFNGIRELRISGIADQPATETVGDTLKIESEGFVLTAVNAEWSVDGQRLNISLP